MARYNVTLRSVLRLSMSAEGIASTGDAPYSALFNQWMLTP